MNLRDIKKLIALILTIQILSSGCQQTINPDISSAVAALKTPAQQQAYLEKVYDEDQYVRTHKQALEQRYGYESDSVKIAGEEMQHVDLLNIEKIEAYLNAHGHPQKALHGIKAFESPIIVIHHSPKGYEHRKQHFKTFYDAYENDLGRISMYLGRMYYEKFGKRMDITGRYTEEFEIDTLIRSMDLLDLLDKDQRVK